MLLEGLVLNATRDASSTQKKRQVLNTCRHVCHAVVYMYVYVYLAPYIPLPRNLSIALPLSTYIYIYIYMFLVLSCVGGMPTSYWCNRCDPYSTPEVRHLHRFPQCVSSQFLTQPRADQRQPASYCYGHMNRLFCYGIRCSRSA